jgi:hypothetical protein
MKELSFSGSSVAIGRHCQGEDSRVQADNLGDGVDLADEDASADMMPARPMNNWAKIM